MSKVVWLEEHRATRQAAIDNAVRLAEAELRLKMEEELEAKLEQRLDEGETYMSTFYSLAVNSEDRL